MKIYAFSGLGADKRVFEHLKLEHSLIPVAWISPNKGEPLAEYAQRISLSIDKSEEFMLMGVSFGGLVAVEIAKLHPPVKLILVSSIEKSDEKPAWLKLPGLPSLLSILPNRAFIPPKGLIAWLFGAENRALLIEILKDTDSNFAKWASIQFVKWKNREALPNTIRIHGSKDKVIPWKSHRKRGTYLIDGGEHFMIVDRADEVSDLSNRFIKNIKDKSTLIRETVQKIKFEADDKLVNILRENRLAILQNVVRSFDFENGGNDFSIAIDWAVELIRADEESDNILMLAATSRNDTYFEISPYILRVLQERNLERIKGDEATARVAFHLVSQIVLDGNLWHSVGELSKLYTTEYRTSELAEFYLIYWTWRDLESGYTSYYLNFTSIDELKQYAKAYSQEWIRHRLHYLQ